MLQQKEEETIVFHRISISNRNKKTKIPINKPIYLRLSILELSRILMSKFLNDYVKPKYVKKANFCYMDTENFFVYIKTDNIYKDIAEDNETRFDISNYELDTSLPKEKKKRNRKKKKNRNWIN